MQQQDQSPPFATYYVNLLVVQFGSLLVAEMLSDERQDHILVPVWQHKSVKGCLGLCVGLFVAA